MMIVIQIGSFAILLKWLLFGVAFLVGIIFIKIWLKRSQEDEISKKLFDLYSNCLFILLIAWKGSLLLLEPILVLKSPLSLLYFTGGNKGLSIAIIITILYFIYKGRKISTQSVIVQSLLIFSLTVASVYNFLFLYLLEEQDLLHLIIGSISSILLYFIFNWDRNSFHNKGGSYNK
jgi:hypothetical protein